MPRTGPLEAGPSLEAPGCTLNYLLEMAYALVSSPDGGMESPSRRAPLAFWLLVRPLLVFLALGLIVLIAPGALEGESRLAPVVRERLVRGESVRLLVALDEGGPAASTAAGFRPGESAHELSLIHI